MSRKWVLILIGIVVVLGGLWFAKVFPDPYHQNGSVNIYVWIWRELDEWIHGEREVDESCKREIPKNYPNERLEDVE